MEAGKLVFKTLVSFNRFLYRWMQSSSRLLYISPPLQKSKSNKEYDAVLQEFVLIKTQYKVLTNVLRKKAVKPIGEFTVKVLD